MKNLVSIIAFAFVLLLGTQNMNAQNLSQDQDRPEVAAKAQTENLTKALELNGDQSRAVFRALVAKEVNYKKHVEGKDLSDPTVAANKKKFDTSLDQLMKSNLNEKQYKKWLTLKDQ